MQNTTAVNEYLRLLPKEKRKALQDLRRIILSVTDLEERMSGGAPFYWYRGRRAVGYGAAKNYLSFFIMHGNVLKRHKEYLKSYPTSSTAVRFTSDKPLPERIITKLVRARMAEINSALKRKESV